MEGTQAASAGRVPVPPGSLSSLWYRERLMERGYIHVWRAIQDNPLWKAKPFSKGQAWIDLLMMAQHSDDDIHLSKGFIIEARRGDVLYGLDYLSKRWGWGKPKVIRFKAHLINQGMVFDVSAKRKVKHERNETEMKSYPKFNILSIQNYNYYQDTAIKGRTRNRTPSVPQTYPPNKLTKNEQTMSARKKADPDVKTFILEWEETWSKKFGNPYTVNWGKEGKLVKEMLKVHSIQELRKLRDDFFKSQDSFIQGSDYSIGVFKIQLNKLIAIRKLDPVEQARDEMRKAKRSHLRGETWQNL